MVALLLLSSALQIAVVIVALRAPRSTRTRSAWWTLAAALALSAMRRLVVLAGHFGGAPVPATRPVEEMLAVGVSALLLVGVLRMRRLWEESDLALEQAQDREAARRESEALWQRVFELAPDGYILVDLDGRLERMNNAAVEIAGLSREQAEGRRIFELGILDADGLAQAARNLGILAEGGNPGPSEYTFHRPDGTVRFVELIGYMTNIGARPVMLTIVHDVTRRKNVEDELRRSRLRLEEAQAVAGVVTFEIDLVGGTMWVSDDPRSTTPLGASGLRMSLEEGLAFIHSDDRERIVRELADGAGDLGREDFTVEYRQYVGDPPRENLVRTKARSDRDESGRVVRMVGATLDVTDIRRAEQEIRLLNAALEERVHSRTAELERAVDELEAFSYSVSHDLRSPLRAMAGYSELVLEEDGEKLSEASRRHLERIQASSVRMGGLIDGLLSLARLTRAARNDTLVDLSDIARGVVAELRQEEPGRRVEVSIHQGLVCVADAGMMELLLQNLLANAWKFTRSRSEARIEVGSDEAGAFFVRDNGVGFDATQKAKLFRPFERLHRHDEFEGNGIGLATVARIVRRHGGEVSAEGAIGRGATFRFSIEPASAEGSATAAHS